MINNKQVNKSISSLLGDEPKYDIRFALQLIKDNLDLETAQRIVSEDWSEDDLITITSSPPPDYAEDVELALYAARRIAERNQYTYVLSFEDGEWRGAFGDYGQCAEHKGSNPAFVTCMSILQFHGRL